MATTEQTDLPQAGPAATAVSPRDGVTWLVVNSASGSASPEALAGVVSALTAMGNEPARVVDCREAPLPDKVALDAAGVSLVVAHAGDGTTGALVAPLEGWGGQVLVLPGGTQNLLARALHGDRSTDAILSALANRVLRPVRRTCIRGAGQVALVEMLAGPGATWSDVREGMREGDLGEVARRTLEAVRLSAAGPKVTLEGCSACRGEGYAGIRLVPNADAMQADGYGAETVGDYLAQGLALLRRDFRDGPHDTLGHFTEATCRSLDGSAVELMIDGERATGSPRERFSLAPLAVDLLAAGDG